MAAAAAASQVQIEGIKPDSSVKASHSCTNGNEQAKTVLQLNELYSFGNDNMPKVRKPYTITKQREKWTEEEHQRFLEALKLYGRGWRKIQEHIGTKTAVQIRSHAQKFFSKVVRESSGSTESSLKSIEIPPPRPKRKPAHPYPRKPVDIYDGTLASNQLERSSSPNSSISEKGSRSPTSVLSALASTLSEQQNGCPSPSSCTTDMRSISLSPIKKESEHITPNSSSDGEKGISSSTQLSSSHIFEKFLSNRFKSAPKDSLSIKGDVTEVASSGSIKLFGKTVMVADIQRKFPSGAELMSSVTSTESQDNVDVGNEKPAQTLQRNQLDTGLSLGVACTNQNVLPSPASVFDFMQLQREITNSSTPCSAFLQDVPFLYLTSYDHASPYKSVFSSMEERSEEKEILNERSCTGSNAGSVGESDNGERNLDVVDSQRQQSSVNLSSSLQKCPRGFVPYKRCLGERDVIPTAIVSKEREPRRARVCS